MVESVRVVLASDARTSVAVGASKGVHDLVGQELLVVEQVVVVIVTITSTVSIAIHHYLLLMAMHLLVLLLLLLVLVVLLVQMVMVHQLLLLLLGCHGCRLKMVVMIKGHKMKVLVFHRANTHTVHTPIHHLLLLLLLLMVVE